MEKINHAKDLVLSQLEREPTPELWCIYGDVTGDEEHYIKAWNLSNHRYSRAKRTLGRIYASRQQWKEAILHFQDALRINPQYADAWYTMGCCCLKLEDWKLGVTCFNRVVLLRPDDGEAWNNLASCHVRLDKKSNAHLSLKEALKYNSDNWRIWENYITISLELKEYFDVILGITRLLDIKDNSVDVDALMQVAQVVIDDIVAGSTTYGKSLTKAFLELMNTITSKVSYSPESWAIYAEYYKAIGDLSKSVEYRAKQCRNLQESEWNYESNKFEKLVLATKYYVEDVLLLNSQDALYSLDLYLISILKQSKETFENSTSFTTLLELHEKVKEALKKE